MSSLREAIGNAIRILSIPAETFNSGAPLEISSDTSASLNDAGVELLAATEKLVGSNALDAYTQALMLVLTTQLATKLASGGYTGTAKALNDAISTANQNIAAKLASGGYTGTGKNLNDAIEALKTTVAKINYSAGAGIKATTSGGVTTLSIASGNGGIIVSEDLITLNLVNNLTSGGTAAALTAEQGKVLYQKIVALKGAIKEQKDYIGTLAANSKSISVGATLYKPALYLDGVRIDKNSFTFSGSTITLSEVYSPKYAVTWYVVDTGVPSTVSVALDELATFALNSTADSEYVAVENIEENEKELTHIFNADNPKEIWDLGVDISNYKRLSLYIGEGNTVTTTTKQLMKKKYLTVPVIFTDRGTNHITEDQVLVLELVSNTELRITSIYDYEKKITNTLYRDIECDLLLEK